MEKIHSERDELSQAQLSLPTCTHRRPRIQPSDCYHLAFERWRCFLPTFCLKSTDQRTRKRSKRIHSLHQRIRKLSPTPTKPQGTREYLPRYVQHGWLNTILRRSSKIWRPTIWPAVNCSNICSTVDTGNMCILHHCKLQNSVYA